VARAADGVVDCFMVGLLVVRGWFPSPLLPLRRLSATSRGGRPSHPIYPQAQVIAESMFLMATLRVPIVCVVIGEGGSGGALGIGVGDRVAMLEHAYYSVISPEGCAGILWKTVEYKADAARALRMRSRDLAEFGVVDAVIEEPAGGAHRHPRRMAARLKMYLARTLRELAAKPRDELVAARYEKFRRMGKFLEAEAAG